MEYDGLYTSCSINKFDMTVSNSLMDCRIFWARVVSGDRESLFTKYQKHTFFEIQFALRGRIGMLLEDGAAITVEESEFLIVPPDTFHQVVDCEESGARFIMGFLPEFRDPRLGATLERAGKPCYQSPHMRQLLGILLQKEYHDEPLRRESITALAECFLMEVLETALGLAESRKKVSAATKAEAEVAKMLSLIHDYNGIGISVSEIAARFMLSERHLTRMFTAVTGVAPSVAIAQEKLKKIEELIVSTPLTFAEIAEICGFSDGYAMNRFFKRHNRVNLSEFRAISGKHRGA